MRKLFAAAAALLVLGLVVVALLTPPRGGRPVGKSSLTLPSGATVRIVGATYGTNHVIGSLLGRVVARMPRQMGTAVERLFGPRLTRHTTWTTSVPKLIVWLENTNASASPTSLYAVLADEAKVVAGSDEWFGSAPLESPAFEVFPRRSPVITLLVFSNRPDGKAKLVGDLRFSNPRARAYGKWKPETLPATKHAGDLEVTLESLRTGCDGHVTYKSLPDGRATVERGTDVSDGRSYAVCNLRLRSLTDTNQVWRVASAEVSDATGNLARNSTMSWDGSGGGFAFRPSLWPGEDAWRLKLELKREKGFRPGEQFVFQGVPLGQMDPTNLISLQTNFAGVTVTFESIYRRAPNTNSSWSSSETTLARFTHSPLPEGTHLDLVRVVANTGTEIRSGSWSSSGTQRSYSFREVPVEARNADFEFVVQRARTVEFLAKPQLASATNAPVAK